MDAMQKNQLLNDIQTAQARDNSRSKAYRIYPENDWEQEIVLSNGSRLTITIKYHDRLQWCAVVSGLKDNISVLDIQKVVRSQTKLDIGNCALTETDGSLWMELN